MTYEIQIFEVFLLVYMAFNCYTDFKWLITKNIWHLTFLNCIAFYSLVAKTIPDMLIMMAFGFFVAYILSKRPGVELGAGDIKMLTVIASCFGVVYGVVISKFVIFVLLYLFSDFLIGIIFHVISKRYKKTIRFGSYKIENGYIEMPQAIPLFIACVLIII